MTKFIRKMLGVLSRNSYGIIMVQYGVMMWYDITEDLKKYDVIGLEWLCKEPNRVIKS